MGTKVLTLHLVLLAALGVPVCSLAIAAGVSKLEVIEDVNSLPGLVDRIKGQIGQDFMLDRLRDGPETLEGGFKFLLTNSSSRLIRETLNQWRLLYGVEFDVEHGEEMLRVFVFAGKPDFSGDFVYAVSQLGYRWPVFLWRERN